MTRALTLSVLFAFLFLVNCNSDEIERLQRSNDALKTEYDELKETVDFLQKEKMKLDILANKLQGITATIKTTEGDIEVEFYPKKAPIHVFSFITRAESGYYDGTTFHRVIQNFMIQGGDPNSKDNNPNNDGTGGPIAAIPHEFNDIKHEPGILSMARTSDKSAGAGSQFFIMHGTSPNLDGEYTAFGKVTKGMDIVNRIATAKKDERDRPLSNITIRTIEVSK